MQPDGDATGKAAMQKKHEKYKRVIQRGIGNKEHTWMRTKHELNKCNVPNVTRNKRAQLYNKQV